MGQPYESWKDFIEPLMNEFPELIDMTNEEQVEFLRSRGMIRDDAYNTGGRVGAEGGGIMDWIMKNWGLGKYDSNIDESYLPEISLEEQAMRDLKDKYSGILGPFRKAYDKYTDTEFFDPFASKGSTDKGVQLMNDAIMGTNRMPQGRNKGGRVGVQGGGIMNARRGFDNGGDTDEQLTPAEQYAQAVKALQEAQGKLPQDSVSVEQSSPFIEGLLQAYGPQLATNLASPIYTGGQTPTGGQAYNQYGQAYGSFLPQAQGQNLLQQHAIQQMLTQQGYGTATFGPGGQFAGIQGTTADQPYGTTGTGIAGYQPYLSQAATDLGGASAAAAAGQGAGAAALGQAGTAFDAAQQAAVAGQGAGAGYMGPGAYQQFMTGYEQDVLDPVLQQYDINAAQQQQNLGLAAAQQGAYGSGRYELKSGVQQEQSNLNRALTSAQLMLQGHQQAQQQANAAFTQAQQQAGQDVSMYGQVGQAQQQLAQGLQGQAGQNVGLFGQAGQGQQSMAALQPQLATGMYGALGQFGTQQQQQGQAVLDTAIQGNQMTAFQPQQGLGFFGGQLAGIMGAYAPQQTFSTLPPQQQASPMSMLLSGLGTGAAVGNMYGWGQGN